MDILSIIVSLVVIILLWMIHIRLKEISVNTDPVYEYYRNKIDTADREEMRLRHQDWEKEKK